MLAKLGLSFIETSAVDAGTQDDVDSLISDLLVILQNHHIDFTQFFRLLSTAVDGDGTQLAKLFTKENADDGKALDNWLHRWQGFISRGADTNINTTASMNNLNPVYIPRNHLVEEALVAATHGDLGPFNALLAVITHPFDEQPDLQRYAEPAPDDFGPYRTFCGT